MRRPETTGEWGGKTPTWETAAIQVRLFSKQRTSLDVQIIKCGDKSQFHMCNLCYGCFWHSLLTHKWRCWVAVNHMALNKSLPILKAQLLPFVFLSHPFCLVTNWLQAPLALEFVQLDGTLGRRGALGMGFSWVASPGPGGSILPVPPPAEQGWGPMPEPDGLPRPVHASPGPARTTDF